MSTNIHKKLYPVSRPEYSLLKNLLFSSIGISNLSSRKTIIPRLQTWIGGGGGGEGSGGNRGKTYIQKLFV